MARAKGHQSVSDRDRPSELTVAIVGEPPCNDSLLRFDCIVHLCSPVLARPTLVIQGFVDGTWKYVMMNSYGGVMQQH